MPGILIVDDDAAIRTVLRRALVLEGYSATVAEDGPAALRLARESAPDAVILDVVLPGADGMEVCRRLREVSDVPVLMLTARDAVGDRVQGLDAGADDYLVKPFELEELLARVRALLRRRQHAGEPVRGFADLSIDLVHRVAYRGERRLDLSSRQWELLLYFLSHPGEVLDRRRILDAVWGYSGDSRVVDVYISYLRERLEAGGEPRLIQTVRGEGYVLRDPTERTP